MKKKTVLAVTAAAAAALALVSCAKARDEKERLEPGTADKDTAGQEGREERAVTDLTDMCSTSVNIDYNIRSYQDLQDFSYRLFRENMDSADPVLSPVSAYLALTMAGIGSDKETRAEFDKVLGEDMLILSEDMLNTLPAGSDGLTLMLADSAWIDEAFIVDGAWLGQIKSLLDAQAYQADLSGTEAMDSMNGWIRDNTNGMIEKMLEGPLDDDARLVLFNTIYFKGRWSAPFRAGDTYQDGFHLKDGQTIQVDMMHKYEVDLDYVSNDFAQGLIFPYRTDDAEHDIAMVVLKPADGVDVRELGSRLDREELSELLTKKQTLLVNTKLPRFEIAFERELNDSLEKMGLQLCFDDEKADFGLMGRNVDGENLYISLVRQKAKIIVDEEGTEAAAATEVAMAAGCALIVEEPLNVYFDEPFLYMIMDMDREIPLFIGILDDPTGCTPAGSQAHPEGGALWQ